jgi:hypothetical protein
VLAGKRPDGRPRQWRDVQAAHPGSRRHLAHDEAQVVARGQVLRAVGDEDQRVAGVNAAREVAQQVEGRLVGPVRVLDHEHIRRGRGRRPEGGDQSAEDLVAGRSGRPDVGRQGRQKVDERLERRRGRRTVAGPEPRAGGVTGAGHEGADERALTAPSLTADEDEPPMATGGLAR